MKKLTARCQTASRGVSEETPKPHSVSTCSHHKLDHARLPCGITEKPKYPLLQEISL